MQSICKPYYLVLACFFYDAAATVDPETQTRFPYTGKPILFTVEHDKKITVHYLLQKSRCETSTFMVHY